MITIDETRHLKPVKFELKAKFCKLVAGESHFAALSTTGALFTWGIAEYGQLGRPFSEQRTYINGNDFMPTKIFLNEPVLDIYCGGFSTIIKTQRGIFCCGKNSFGELGLGDMEPREFFQELEFFANHQVKDIVGGLHHTLVLTDLGLFGMGKNLDGQVGLADIDYISIPTKIDIKNVAQIAAGMSSHHSYVIDTDGQLFTAGQNQYEQLGHPITVIRTFSKVNLKGRKCLNVDGGCQFTIATLSDCAKSLCTNTYQDQNTRRVKIVI